MWESKNVYTIISQSFKSILIEFGRLLDLVRLNSSLIASHFVNIQGKEVCLGRFV